MPAKMGCMIEVLIMLIWVTLVRILGAVEGGTWGCFVLIVTTILVLFAVIWRRLHAT